MSQDLLLRGLTRRHDGVAVLDDLSLQVPAGSCLALLGPSGSGKTTALRLVAGLDRPDAGDVLVGGTSLLGQPPEHRPVALLQQRPLLFPHLSVLDNVAFPVRVRGAHRRQARHDAGELLELVGLTGLGGRRPHELSGGQAQRAALARALAAEPDVLLLDEPFGALDPELREQVHDLLRDVRARLSPTVVLVTHDPQEATALADEVAVLLHGRLHQVAQPAQLYAAPASVEVARLLGGRNELPGPVVGGVHRSAVGDTPTALPDGPALLLVRQEAIGLLHADDPAACAVGEVRRVRLQGARRLLSLQVRDAVLHVEVGPGAPVLPGDRVGVLPAEGSRTVVPVAEPTKGPGRCRT